MLRNEFADPFRAYKIQGSGFRGSGFSPATGLNSGQFNRKINLLGTCIKLIMAIYEILIVGAAFSRDNSVMAMKRLFFAAKSRYHEKLMLI